VTQFDRVRRACEAVGRDPGELVYSAAQVLCCGVDDREVALRAAAIGRDPRTVAEQSSCAGTVSQVVDALGRWQAAGVQRVYLQVLDLADLEHLALVAEQVRPALAG
jgi:alkanesulfonate monooxygenase SsuD/methylene tetrahydromethanopterin reductase-like flavin-dependent oxidoreductase (luciferase family)